MADSKHSGPLKPGSQQSNSNGDAANMIKHRRGQSVPERMPAETVSCSPTSPFRSATPLKKPSPAVDDKAEDLTTTLYITNLHCPSCVVNIKDTLGLLEPAPTGVSTSIISHSVIVHHSSLLRTQDISTSLENEGFDIHSIFQRTPRGQEEVQVVSSANTGDDWENSFTEAVARWRRSFREHKGLRSPRSSYLDEYSITSYYGRNEQLDRMGKEMKHSENCAECRQERGLEKASNQPTDIVPLRQVASFNDRPRGLAPQASFDTQHYRPSTDTTYLPSGEEARAKALAKKEISVIVDPTSAAGTFKADISIVGMTCSACVGAITNAVEELPFVRTINVSLLTHSATVVFEGNDHAEQVRSTIEDAGFDATIEGLEEIGGAKKRRTLVLEGGGDVWKATYMIGGMTCAACVGNVSTVVKQLDFVNQVDINLIQNSGVVEFKGKDNVGAITEAIEDAGFDATLENMVNAAAAEQEETYRTVSFRVDGMFCHHCPTHIVDALEQEFKGKISLEKIATTADPIFEVQYAPHAPHFTIRTIFDLVASVNPEFKPTPYHAPTLEDRSRALHARERRTILLRLALCVTAGIPAFIIGIVCMSLLHHDNAVRTFMMAPMWTGTVSRSEWALFILATPVYFFGADIFHRKAIKEVKAMWRPGSKTPMWKRFVRFGSMNMLMCLGTSIAYFSSIAELIIGALEKPKHGGHDMKDMKRAVLAVFKRQDDMPAGHSHPTEGDATEPEPAAAQPPAESPAQQPPAESPAPQPAAESPVPQPPAAESPAPMPTDMDMIWTSIGLSTLTSGPTAAPTPVLGIDDMSSHSGHLIETDTAPSPFAATATTIDTLSSQMHSGHNMLPTASALPGMGGMANSTLPNASGGTHSMDGSGIYFDSVIFLTMFLLMGRFLEAYSKAKTGDAVTNLGNLRPSEAILVESTNVSGRKIPVALLDVGDVVRVQAGGSPPFDGIIIDGSSRFDESSLTGESRPVQKEIGDTVYSGTVNRTGPVSMKLTTTDGSSMLDQIIKVVREGQTHRAPVERAADIITSHFVPFVILVAIVTWTVWLATGMAGLLPDSYLDNSQGGYPLWSLRFAIAVFVVACPCGIGLAAPTAMFVGGGLAAKFGILVKGGGEAFQEASDLDVVVFDKTGTLTEGGDPKVTGWKMTSDDDADEVLAMVRQVESGSGHPVAKAVMDFCEERLGIKSPSKDTDGEADKEMDISDSKPGAKAALDELEVRDAEEVPGMGMTASFALPLGGLASDGAQKSGALLDVDVLVGNERLLEEHDVGIDEHSYGILQGWKRQGRSVVLVALRAAYTTPEELRVKSEAKRQSISEKPSTENRRFRSSNNPFKADADHGAPLRPPRPSYLRESRGPETYSMSDYGDELQPGLGSLPGNRSGTFYPSGADLPQGDPSIGTGSYMPQSTYWDAHDTYNFPLPPTNNSKTERYSRNPPQSIRSSIHSTVGTGTYILTSLFAISDPLRDEAPGIVSALTKRGIEVWMLSGDNPTTAQAVAAQVGIKPTNVIAGVLPEQKAEKIKWLQKTVPARKKNKKKQRSQRKRSNESTDAEESYPAGRATVAMVGDGINDSPALTMADVGIAIGSGSDIAISSADFILIHSKLSSVLTLIDLSRKVFRRVWFNFGWACVYNLIAMPVAAGVLYPVESNGAHVRLDPVWASLAMACSSLSVVGSSLALRSRLPGLGFRYKK